MSTWESAYIEANGLQLHYTRTGGAKPPVVLAHGFSDDGLCWTPVAEVLAADYDVIMVDARGHGRSDGPEAGYGSVEHAADLAGLIAGLKLDRPAVLGHSMGAASALALAALYPGAPRAILLEDPPAWWMPPPEPDPAAPAVDWAARSRKWINELKRKTRDELITEQHAQSPAWSEAELGPWADSKLRLSFNVLNRRLPPDPDSRPALDTITCPVLLITADPEMGGIVTPEAASALKARLPQTRVAHIPGAGHNVRREQFARYIEVVCAFLQETIAS